MGKSIVCEENESLTYEELCDKFSLLREEFNLVNFSDDDYPMNDFNEKELYSNVEKKSCIKECISNMLRELQASVNMNYGNRDIHILWNDSIENWNEVIASIRINRDLLELKLTNEYMSDYDIDLNHIYITVFLNGKGLFTEWIENVHEEYEFAGCSSEVKNENDLYIKNIEKEKFIDKVLKQINILI